MIIIIRGVVEVHSLTIINSSCLIWLVSSYDIANNFNVMTIIVIYELHSVLQLYSSGAAPGKYMHALLLNKQTSLMMLMIW